MRTRTFLTVLAGLVIMAGLSNLSMAAANQISHYLHYDDTPVIGTDTLGGVTYSTFSYGDLFNSGEPGKPSLPVDYISFSVPYNATNFSATVTWRMNVSYNLDHLLYPCQAPRWMNDTTPATITLPDTAAYYSGESYPSQRAWVVDEGFLEGENHIVTVAVMPFSYSHSESSDLVSLRKTGTLRLSYELSDSLDIYPIVREDSALREEGYRLAQSMVVNPNQVKSFTVSYNPIGTGVGPIGPINPNGVLPGDGVNGGSLPFFPSDSLTQDSDYVDPNPGIAYDAYARIPYLIVTTNEFCHSLRRLAALKRQKGYNVQVVTMNDVMNDSTAHVGDIVNSHVTFTDSAGVLRQYLRNCRQYNGTRFVLLVGTSIPYRHRDDIATDGFKTKNIDGISDFYYSELNSDWSQSTIQDHAPDLFVGRILAKESAQIDNYIDKLLRYELNPGDGEYSYLRKLLYEEGQSFVQGLRSFKNHIFNVFPENRSIELKETLDIRPTGKEVIDTLNSNPVGLVTIMNHGDTTSISVYADEYGIHRVIHSISSIAHGDGLNCLNNRDYPTVFYSPACQTVPFDNRIGINMGESFTTGKDYGGAVYIGNTRTIVTATNNAVTGYFAEKLSEGYSTLGIADALSVWDYQKERFKCQDPSLIHAYLGDPTLELWTAIPHVFRNIYVTRTDNSLNIIGLDKDSITIAYCCNDYSFKKIVNSYSATINDSPNASVMVYGHNCIPYIIPMVLHVFTGDFIAGNSVDSNRTSGDVTIKTGARYEIEAAGTTWLYGGFKVEPGASFSVVPASFGDKQYLY